PQAALHALVHRGLGLADLVRHEIQREQLPGVADREHPGEHFLQALVAAAHGIHLELQEVPEALELDFQQIRDLQVPLAVDLGEALAIFTACCLQRLPAFPNNGDTSTTGGASTAVGRSPPARPGPVTAHSLPPAL